MRSAFVGFFGMRLALCHSALILDICPNPEDPLCRLRRHLPHKGGEGEQVSPLADQAVVFGMAADPEPVIPVCRGQRDRPMVNADPHRPDFADALEAQGRMSRIMFQQLEILVCQRPDFSRQRMVVLPIAGGCAVNRQERCPT